MIGPYFELSTEISRFSGLGMNEKKNRSLNKKKKKKILVTTVIKLFSDPCYNIFMEFMICRLDYAIISIYIYKWRRQFLSSEWVDRRSTYIRVHTVTYNILGDGVFWTGSGNEKSAKRDGQPQGIVAVTLQLR